MTKEELHDLRKKVHDMNPTSPEVEKVKAQIEIAKLEEQKKQRETLERIHSELSSISQHLYKMNGV